MQEDDKARGGRRRNKPLPPDPDQEFLSRNRQLQIIRDCVLPERPGVSSVVMKAVLRVLDDRIGARNKECWPSQSTLALNVGLKDRKQIQRAIDVLENDLSVIYVRRGPRAGGGRGGTVNHYRLVWNELALLCPAESINRPTEATTAAPESIDQSDIHVPLVANDQSDIYARPMGHEGATNGTSMSHEAPILEAPKKRPPPPKPPPEFSDLPPDWAAVVNDFRSRQTIVTELAREHLTAGISASEFRERLVEAWDVVELPENRGKFDRPAGAVAFYLRNGAWPRDAVVTIERAAELRAERAAAIARLDKTDLLEQARAVAGDNAETVYGELLDSLSESDLQDLIAATPKLQDAFFVRWLNRRPPSGFVRELLLKTLARTFDERKSHVAHAGTQASS